MKIAVFSTCEYDREFLDRFNTGHELTYYAASLTHDTVNLARDFDAICIFVNDQADEPVLEMLHSLGIRLIVLRCAGFNNVAIGKANELGIKVVRVPAYAPEAVAEHALALMMTLNRKTHKAYNRVREGNFSLERLTGFNMFGKKVAVIGTGLIGKALCRILLGLGCHVSAFDVFPSEELKELGVVYGTLEEALNDADIISLHCPLNTDTKHLINKDTLKLFKKGAMLINTSRGGLIDTKDVIHALKNGQIGYLGLDVYEQEGNLFFQNRSEDVIQDELITRLISFPNVLITSHQGFFTREALEEISKISFGNVDAFDRKEPLLNEVKL